MSTPAVERPPLDPATVRRLHLAVRGALRLRAGLDPGWRWSGHSPDEFVRGARGHHVCGLLGAHAVALGLPAAPAARIAAHADRVALSALAQAARLRQVHRILRDAGVPALFFKGLAVEAQTGRRLGERGSGDIDVWVPPECVETAVAALRSGWHLPTNYPQPGPSWAWRHWLRWGSELPLRGPVTVDLHWHLHGVRANLPDFDTAWAAREHVDVGGHTVPTLARAHALAHAVRHATTDRWRILRSLVDIHLLLTPAAPAAAPAVLPGPAMAVVDRAVGLPGGRTGASLAARRWAAVCEEQRFLGPHVDRIDALSRPAYLARVLARATGPGRHPARDAMALLWFLAVAPPHRSGSITTTSAVRGTGEAVRQRVRYERDRVRSPVQARGGGR